MRWIKYTLPIAITRPFSMVNILRVLSFVKMIICDFFLIYAYMYIIDCGAR